MAYDVPWSSTAALVQYQPKLPTRDIMPDAPLTGHACCMSAALPVPRSTFMAFGGLETDAIPTLGPRDDANSIPSITITSRFGMVYPSMSFQVLKSAVIGTTFQFLDRMSYSSSEHITSIIVQHTHGVDAITGLPVVEIARQPNVRMIYKWSPS